MHFELEEQRTYNDQLCNKLVALAIELRVAQDDTSAARKARNSMTDEIEDLMDCNWKAEQRDVAAVKLAASRQDEICALKTRLGDLGHLANELRAKLELQEAERAFRDDKIGSLIHQLEASKAENASFAESIAHSNAVIGRQRDEAEELKLRNGGLHAENSLQLTESSLRGEKVDALTRRLDASEAEIKLTP